MEAKEKPQSERFIEKAKELGADESGEAFERALKKVIHKNPSRSPPPKDAKPSLR